MKPHPLQPAGESEVAVVVDPSEVAGAEPRPSVAVPLQCLCSRIRVVEVPEHHRRSADADLSLLPRSELTVGAGGEQRGDDVGERHADCSFPRRVEWVAHNSRDGFGEAITLEHLDVPAAYCDEPLERLAHDRLQDVGAREKAARRLERSACWSARCRARLS